MGHTPGLRARRTAATPPARRVSPRAYCIVHRKALPPDIAQARNRRAEDNAQGSDADPPQCAARLTDQWRQQKSTAEVRGQQTASCCVTPPLSQAAASPPPVSLSPKACLGELAITPCTVGVSCLLPPTPSLCLLS